MAGTQKSISAEAIANLIEASLGKVMAHVHWNFIAESRLGLDRHGLLDCLPAIQGMP
jgi:hypothetical protein